MNFMISKMTLNMLSKMINLINKKVKLLNKFKIFKINLISNKKKVKQSFKIFKRILKNFLKIDNKYLFFNKNFKFIYYCYYFTL